MIHEAAMGQRDNDTDVVTQGMDVVIGVGLGGTGRDART